VLPGPPFPRPSAFSRAQPSCPRSSSILPICITSLLQSPFTHKNPIHLYTPRPLHTQSTTTPGPSHDPTSSSLSPVQVIRPLQHRSVKLREIIAQPHRRRPPTLCRHYICDFGDCGPPGWRDLRRRLLGLRLRYRLRLDLRLGLQLWSRAVSTHDTGRRERR
jgi:hypothetical protein